MVEATLTPVERGTVSADANGVFEGHTRGTASEPNPEIELLEAPVYNVVIDHPAGTILWDTGSHPDAATGHWPAPLYDAFKHTDLRPLEDDLADAGYSVSDIDAVIQSHLHLDHAGGLYAFEGTETPIYVHERELKYAYYSAKTDTADGDPAYLAGDFDRDLAWKIVHGDRAHAFEGIEFVRLPGHTPGLLGVVLELDGTGTVVLAGDQAFLRANYEDEHPMGGDLLWSKRDWFESLRRVRKIARRQNATVICGHDPGAPEQLRSL
ncbi:N-acyl homoserine lactonase family protein [Halobacteria archaeon AArc-dxtr1]|nr:N-acyl homoserine lactonase family protein [Halobacteria archaeon AArc-dxtr1]